MQNKLKFDYFWEADNFFESKYSMRFSSIKRCKSATGTYGTLYEFDRIEHSLSLLESMEKEYPNVTVFIRQLQYAPEIKYGIVCVADKKEKIKNIVKIF